MSPLETILHECGSAAGIGFWRFDAARGLLHWPRDFGPARDQSYGSWWRLGEFGQFFDAAERARFFDYFENLFDAEHPPFTLEIPIKGPNGPMQLRIEGKQLHVSDQLFAGGLVRDITRRADAEERARHLGQILDALLATVQAGVVVLDSRGHVRKANDKMLRLFGVEPKSGAEAAALAALEASLPASLSETIAGCRVSRQRTTGASPGVGSVIEPMTWEASPWGKGGVVAVVRPESLRAPERRGAAAQLSAVSDHPPAASHEPKPSAPAVSDPAEPADPLAKAAFERARGLLDHVHHACLIIQSRDASIEFANKVARERLGIRPTGKVHLNNLFELTGRHPPRHTYVTTDRVNAIVTLPMGARVSRMTDLDPDLYFVEYI